MTTRLAPELALEVDSAASSKPARSNMPAVPV
jgi:hypothetical protein